MMTMLMTYAGCQQRLGPVGLNDLKQTDPLKKISAIKWAANQKLQEAILPLIDCLEDEDRSVRFFAIQALREITNKKFGFDYKSDFHERSKAIVQWRKYAESQAS